MPIAHSLDITKSKHRGSPTSNAAYKRVAPSAASFRQAILLLLLRKGAAGMTCKEVAAHFKAPMHSVSGRITELKLAERVASTGDRRDGGNIIVALNPTGNLFSAASEAANG